jgi:predicted transport protein
MRFDFLKDFDNRTGEINLNKDGLYMKIIEYRNCGDITIEFQDEYKTQINTRYYSFKQGKINNPNNKTVYKIGRMGQGKYKSKINEKQTIQYQYWSDMLRRCYSDKFQEKEPTYKGCLVCEEWHNFQNFAKWFDENYYTIDGDFMCLDKDILHKGNKLYLPDNCVFVPNRINVLFTKNNAIRGEYPIGVSWNKRSEKFKSTCSIFNGEIKISKSLGYYNTSLEAFYKYKEFKEKYIKQVAEEYKDRIPNKLYNAMYNWIVEITD